MTKSKIILTLACLLFIAILHSDDLSDAKAYLNSRKYDQAIEAYTRVIQRGTNDDDVYYSRGYAYSRKQDNEKAIADYTKAIQLKPQKASYYFLRGSLYSDTNNHNKAIEDYTKAIQLDSQKPSYYNNRGFSHYKKNDYTKAIEDYSKAIQLSPNDANYYFSRGRAYYDKGDTDKSITDFEASLKIDPSSSDTKQMLAKAVAKKTVATSKANKPATTNTPLPEETTLVEPEIETPVQEGGYSSFWLWFFLIVLLAIAIYVYIKIKAYKTENQSFICPYCYSKHLIKECDMKCTYNHRGSLTQICKNGVEKDDGFIPRYRQTICLKCTDASTYFICKVMDKEIPSDFLSMTSLRIALLGAKASGKSNYIGVTVNEILLKMSSPFNTMLSKEFSKESRDAYNENYYRPLYLEGYPVGATDAGQEIPPMIFPLEFIKSHKKTALTFYDTAGENLNDITDINKFASYIVNAHGIILLLDPLQDTEIRKQLKAKAVFGLPEQNADTSDVLDKIITVIKRTKKISGKIDIPLALVFTKIDMLEKYDMLPADSCLRSESEHLDHGKFVYRDFDNTQLEMEKLIGNWIKGALMGYISQFKTYALFGVTSLGANPTGNKLSREILPRRVLDPLLWFLAREKYIKTMK